MTKSFHICGTIWSNFEVPGGTFWYIFGVLGPFGPSLGAKVEKGLLLESILEGFWEALGTLRATFFILFSPLFFNALSVLIFHRFLVEFVVKFGLIFETFGEQA